MRDFCFDVKECGPDICCDISLFSLLFSSITQRKDSIWEIVDRPLLKSFWLWLSMGFSVGTMRFRRNLL